MISIRRGTTTRVGAQASWLLLLAALSLYGCSGGGPRVATEQELEQSAEGPQIAPATGDPMSDPIVRYAPPAVVPVGVDTAFVAAADSAFGVVLDTDTLSVMRTESRALATEAQVVDTLAAVVRFLQTATGGSDRHAMSAVDSQVVGRLVLEGMAPDDQGAVLMLGLEGAINDLEAYTQQADSLGADLEWNSKDPSRNAQSREVKVAVLGFSDSSRALRDQLMELQAGLEASTATADSARTQQEIGKLVREFGSDLDRTINDLGRAAQNVTPGSLTSESLRGLQQNLVGRQTVLLEFEARWQQFEQTGALELANPGGDYNSGRMLDLLNRMEQDLQYLSTLAGQRATALDSAGNFQDELQARREAEDYVRKTQETLIELKERNQALVGAYSRLASRYWKGRLDQVASQKEEREQLYVQLEGMIARSGGAERIREDADLLAAFSAASDRLVVLRREQLGKVRDHDGMRQSVQASLAADLYNRARVLGNPEDYSAAMAAYSQLQDEQPGEYPWFYQMASLAWHRSRESWAPFDDAAVDSSNRGLPTVVESRQQANGWLDRCEEVLLQRHAFDRDMDRTKAELGALTTTQQGSSDTAGDATVANQDPGRTPVARAALFMPADRRWYYRRFVTQARDELAALGDAANEPEVRRWLLNIDILRKRLAFDAADGDRFLYLYARQTLLSEDLDSEAGRQVLEHWSWDAGHLSLRQRWADANLMPDSTQAAATAKRDSLVTLLAEARTPGVRRQISWAAGTIEFLKMQEYDLGLQRMHTLLKETTRARTMEPEVGAIDSTVAAVYPVFLYNRGTYYQQEGQRREAFYCFLGVAEEYAGDRKTAALARYSAAVLLADGNKRGALKLVRSAIGDALRVVGENPQNFDLETLVAMYELRQGLAGDLGLFQEAVQARDEARQLRGLADQAMLDTSKAESAGSVPAEDGIDREVSR